MGLVKNTFKSGLNQDIAREKYSPENYYYANNYRVVTDKGLSTFSLENEKGTKFLFQFPDIGTIYKIEINDDSLAVNLNINANVISLTSTPITIDNLYNAIIGDTGVANDITAGIYNVVKGNDYIYIIELDGGVVPIVSIGLTLTTEVQSVDGDDLKVIGWENLRDDVVVFTTSEIDPQPTSSSGQIWLIHIDDIDELIENDSNGVLVNSEHLKYHHNLNFSTYHRIGNEIVPRYENTRTGRVYWTDNYNRIRVANVYDPNLMGKKPSDLDIVPDLTTSKPYIDSIGSGSIPVGSTVQYFYRLLSTSGAETVVSPGSNLLHLTDADAYTAAFQDYQGATSIGLAARSVTYSIDNIDTDFDVIEHIVVIWDYKDVPNIYKFDEEFIPESGSLTVTHVGNEDYIQIDPLVFNQLSFGPEICKSITYKDNRLIAANIRTERYDINFDSRAYRFNGSNVSNLYNSTNQLEYTINYNGGTYTVPQLLGDWEDIPETADAINPFNNEDLVSNADWATNDQYKYIANTTTLGGNGPNISYQFQTNSFQSDDTFSSSSLSVSPPHISVNRYATGSTASIHDTTVDLSNTFKNFKSPLVDAYFTGYARGEMYRFGIVFYSNKGVPSFVKWIGDIKFPEANEIGYEVGNAGTLKSLGIKFTIDISSVQEEVSGFEIVRVKRTESNRTRLGTGTVLSFILSNGANSLAGITSWHRYASAAAHAGATGDNKTTNVEIDGTVKHCFCLADRPMDGYWAGSSIGDTNRMLAFLSPITQFTTISNFSPKDRDYIKDMGYYTSTIGVYDVDANNSYAFQLKGRNRENVTIPLKYRVDTTKLVDTGGLASDSEIDSINNGSPLSGNPYVLNASHAVDVAAAANSFYPLGVGERCMIMTIYQNPTDVNFSDSSNLNWSGHNPEAQFSFAAPLGEGNYATGTGANNIYWKEIVYCRFISNQYGGNSYADRSKNEYISTGAFTRVDNNSDLSQETIVFGGDVWVNYWDTEYLQYYDSNVDHYKADTTRHVGCATALPVEIPFNIELRRDNHWAADGDGTNMASYLYTEYNYNNVYTQENNARQVYIPKDFLLVENIEHSHRIWASEPKIDGELIDNWRIFKANEWIEVEGIHGQINTIINFRDRVLFYQDNALGIAQINEKATVQNTSGNNPEIVLGTGGVLVDFDYLSTETGSKHQFGVVKSGSRVYHYDANKKKFFALTQNAAQPLSDLKGLSAFFDHEIDFTLLESDLTLDETAEASGVHGVYDSRFNRVLYTFEGAKNYAFTANTQYDEGDIIFYSGSYWSFNEDYTSPNNISGLKIDDLLTELPNFKNAFTISYNEFIDAFESFYGYTPKIYLSSKRWVLSSDPDNPNKVYMHHRGEYGQYYENPAEDSVIEFIVNPEPNVTKIFNNIEWHSEVYDTNENDVYNETFTTLNVNNEYQDTGDITLVPGTNIKRRMRRWRLKIPRHKGTKARIRNPFTTIKFNIDNAPNRRVIINDVITYYTSASM